MHGNRGGGGRGDDRRGPPIEVCWGANGRSHELRDVSARGLFVVTADELPAVGSELELLLRAGDHTIKAQGQCRVVWVQPGEGMGLEFVSFELSDAQLAWFKERLSQADRFTAAELSTKVKLDKPRALTIGIDLGTSNTCASVVKGGKPMVIPTRYGTNTIPSVLSLDEQGAVLVGEAAQRRMILNTGRTVYGSKRLIGRSYRQDTAEEFQPYFAYPIVETPAHGFGALLDGEVISMEDVAHHLLAEVRRVAEEYLSGRVQRAVITVPAYFSEVQRNAVRRAAHKTGLQVARIVNEPTAAAVAYGYKRDEQARLAVFDLGGGTFDVSILEVRGNDFRVLATGGDCFLGGSDFDDLLASHLLEEFMRATGQRLEPSAQQLARLREAAVEAKRGLSVQHRIVVSLPQFAEVDGQFTELHQSVSREQLLQMSEGLLARMRRITLNVCAEARLEPGAMNEVLLVGGSTRMPIVRSLCEEVFAKRPSQHLNPDEAVALGAALLAHSEVEERVKLVDVLPLSVGVSGAGRKFVPLIRRNTSVPAQRSFNLSTSRDNQTHLTLPLFQGERADAAQNEYLGTLVIDHIAPGPKGSQAFKLLLALDAQCKLSVRGNEANSGVECRVRVDRSRGLDAVRKELGPYRGPQPARTPARPPSTLGRLFSSLRRLIPGAAGNKSAA